MNKYNSNQNKDNRKDWRNRFQEKWKFIFEDEEEAAIKFLAAENYDSEDIKKCVQRMLTERKYDYSQQFVLLEKIPQFDIAFGNVNIERAKPFFSVVAKFKHQWVLLCIFKHVVYTEEKLTVFYKDPSGQGIPAALKRKLDTKFRKYDLQQNLVEDQHYSYDAGYGPLTLRNLFALLDFLQKKTSLFLFKRLNFFKLNNLRKERLRIMAQVIEKLSKDEAFKVALANFLKNLPFNLNLAVRQYQNVLDEELDKDEGSVNHDRIAEARNKFLTDEMLNQLESNYSGKYVKKDFVLEIQEKFPKQMKQITSLFKFIEGVKVGKPLLNSMDTICGKLKLNAKIFDRLYQLRAEEKPKTLENKGNHAGDLFTRISSSLPEMDEVERPKGRSLNQILNRIDYGKTSVEIPPDENPEEEEEDDDDFNNEELNPDPKASDLAQTYQLIEQCYEQWKDSSIESINAWAKKMKGHFSTIDSYVYEAIAIMDRAFNLLTGGFRLSPLQILSIVVFVNSGYQDRHICEIKSGEGKTMIIAAVAVVMCLNGYTVDVITGSPVLAEKCVEATKKFFAVFDLQVSTNNHNVGYSADIVYGAINSFQMDYLKDFYEDGQIRKNRNFDVLILDEIDCMLIDNGERVARLTRTYPGMDFFRYIYIKIWEELHKAEEVFSHEIDNIVKEKLSQFSEEEAKREIEKYFQDLIVNERSAFKDKIKASNPTDFNLIPEHWKEFVQVQLKKWLKSAVHAKYYCHEHRNYKIIKMESGKRKIVPILHRQAGFTLRNSVWVNGLYQFVQLKHNLEISMEKLPTCLISNCGYIRLYKNGIFGLTSALGSVQEREHLTKLYNVDYVKMPANVKRKFHEIPGIIYDDDSWPSKVALKIAAEADAGRTVLAVFETEEDVLIVRTKLELLQEAAFTIKTYLDEENVAEEEKAISGLIVLTTYGVALLVRFQVGEDVQSKGGVHVCACFLPCNIRVEEMVFSRTARQGESGSAQLIIKRTELAELSLGGESVGFNIVKEKREEMERCRIRYVNDIVDKELNFYDDLYLEFTHLCRRLSNQVTTQSYKLALLDFQEFWAFWVAQRNFQADTIVTTTPYEEFVKFQKEAQLIIYGKIRHNPYYCISLGGYYLRNDSVEKARPLLEYAVKIAGGKQGKTLIGAHMKHFETHIKDGLHILDKLQKVTKDVIPIEIDGFEDYKKYARDELERARVAAKCEIDYIERMLSDKNDNFLKILNVRDVENDLVKQIYAKLFCLKFHEASTEYLIETLDQAKGDVHLVGKSNFSFANFIKMSTEYKKLENILSEQILLELRSSGLDTIYYLKELADIPDSLSQQIKKHLRLGMIALSVGLALPAAFTLMAPIATTLISESIVDSVIEILDKTQSGPGCKNYAKRRLIKSNKFILRRDSSSQAVNLVKMGINICQELSSFLRSLTRFKAMCNRLVTFIDRLGNILYKKLVLTEFLKMDTATQLNHMINLKNSGDTVTFDRLGGDAKLQELLAHENVGIFRSGIITFQDTAKTLWSKNKDLYNSLTKQITNASTSEQTIADIVKTFFQTVEEGIKSNQVLLRKLHTTTTENIFKALDGLTQKEQFVAVKKIIAEQIIDRFLSTELAERFTIVKDFIESTPELNEFVSNFSSKLEKKLRGGKAMNDVQKVVTDICAKLEADVLAWVRIMIKGTQTVVEYGVAAKGFLDKCNLCGGKMNHYQTLGVTKESNLLEVKAAYRKKILAIQEEEIKDEEEKEKKLLKVHDAYSNIVRKLSVPK